MAEAVRRAGCVERVERAMGGGRVNLQNKASLSVRPVTK